MAGMLCAKFQQDSLIDKWARGKRGDTRFESKTDFEWTGYIGMGCIALLGVIYGIFIKLCDTQYNSRDSFETVIPIVGLDDFLHIESFMRYEQYWNSV